MKTDLSQKSRTNVIKAFSIKSVLTKGEIETITKLSPASVSILISVLEEEGIVERYDYGLSNGGRRPLLYKLRDSQFTSADYRFSVSGITFSVIDINGNVAFSLDCEEQIDSPDRLENAFLQLAERAEKLAPELIENVSAVGISIPGIINYSKNIVTLSVPLSLESYHMRPLVEKVYGKDIPLMLFNDSDALLLGEYHFGNHGCENLALIMLDEGIGFSVIQNGSLMTSDNCGMELGHTVISMNGDLCRCGRRGCASTFLNSDRIRADYSAETEGRGCLGSHSYSDLAAKANSGDEVALNVLSRQIYYLAVLAANTVNLFNPSKLLISSPLAAYDRFEELFDREVKGMALAPFAQSVKVCTSSMDIPASLAAMSRRLNARYYFETI